MRRFSKVFNNYHDCIWKTSLVHKSFERAGIWTLQSPGRLESKTLWLIHTWFWTHKINCQILSELDQWCLQLTTESREAFVLHSKRWPRRDLNTQPSDLESNALPLRHKATQWDTLNVFISPSCHFATIRIFSYIFNELTLTWIHVLMISTRRRSWDPTLV